MTTIPLGSVFLVEDEIMIRMMPRYWPVIVPNRLKA